MSKAYILIDPSFFISFSNFYAFIFQFDDVYSNDRIAQSAADKSEIAASKVKIEGLQSQVTN